MIVEHQCVGDCTKHVSFLLPTLLFQMFFKSQTLRPQTIEIQDFVCSLLHFAGMSISYCNFTSLSFSFFVGSNKNSKDFQVFSAEGSDDMDTQQMKIWDRARGTQVEADGVTFLWWEKSSGFKRENRLTFVAEVQRRRWFFGGGCSNGKGVVYQ